MIPQALRLYGHSVDAGDFRRDEIQAQIREGVRVNQALDDLINEGRESNLEFEIVPADGSPTEIINSVAMLIKDEQGIPIKILGFIQDITDRRRFQQALDEVKKLRGIVPICACCKKIRDDDGYRSLVEQYVSEHTYAKFSHGICPACYTKEMNGIKGNTSVNCGERSF